MSNRERAIQLMERIVTARQELKRLESELDALLPSEEPKVARTTTGSSVGGNGSRTAGDLAKRGGLTEAVRQILRTSDRDLTSREIVEIAGARERQNSVYAAVSRMVAAGEVQKGTVEGTYRIAKKH